LWSGRTNNVRDRVGNDNKAMGKEQRNNFNMEDAYDLRLNKFTYVTVCGHRPYKDKNVAHPEV